MADRVPQSTRQIFNAIFQLNTLSHTLYNRVRYNTPGEGVKLKKLIIDVNKLISDLEGLVEKEAGKKGASIDQVKEKLKAEAQKRRAGQMKSSDMCEEPVEKGANHAGVMVALYPPSSVAKKIAVPGGEPVQDLHITLAYCKDQAADRDDWSKAAEVVQKVAARHQALEGHYGGHGRFIGEDEDVVWLSPDVPGINDLHQDLVKELDAAGFEVSKDHGFTPHTSAKYVSKDDETPELLSEKIPVKFAQIFLVVGGKKTPINLGSK